MLKSGSSYVAANELVLTFGLGQLSKANAVEIRWPSGQVDKLSNVNAGQTVTVTEGKGVTAGKGVTKKKGSLRPSGKGAQERWFRFFKLSKGKGRRGVTVLSTR